MEFPIIAGACSSLGPPAWQPMADGARAPSGGVRHGAASEPVAALGLRSGKRSCAPPARCMSAHLPHACPCSCPSRPACRSCAVVVRASAEEGRRAVLGGLMAGVVALTASSAQALDLFDDRSAREVSAGGCRVQREGGARVGVRALLGAVCTGAAARCTHLASTLID